MHYPGVSCLTKTATAAVLVLLPIHHARALDVTVTGLRSSTGDVVVCIWRQGDKGFPNCGTGEPFKKVVAPATTPRVSFGELPSGPYAISMFHDEKRLGKPETNIVGAPKSGVGLTNNPKLGMTNLPTFEKGRIAVPETKSVTLETQYLF
jgi:uncharacterized protein (DUF2141 family)